MKPDDIHKLLGGYATSTLTEAEQRALLEAALHDQELFDALAREQSLRDLLRDPAARAELLSALQPVPRTCWNWRPAAAVLAMAGIAALAVVLARRPHPFMVPQAPQPVQPPLVAQVAKPPAPEPPPPAAKPRPAARRRQPQVPPPLASPPPPSAPASGSLGQIAAISNPDTQTRAALAAPVSAPVLLAEAPKPAAQAKAMERLPAIQPQARTNMFAPEAQPPQSLRLVPAAAAIPPPTARALFLGVLPQPVISRTAAAAGSGGARQPASLALRYSILRQDAAGNFVEAALSNLESGDTVELRVTANANGYLAIGEAAPVALIAMAPYTTPPLPAGQSEIQVLFSTEPERALQLPPAEIPLTEVAGRDTYVANRVPGRPLRFTIRLK